MHLRALTAALIITCVIGSMPSVARAANCGDIPDVMVLLDRSGSMKELVGGQSKAAIARAAIQDLLQQFAGQIAFGMALFPRWPHVKDCSMAQVNVGPSLTSNSAITGLLNSNYPDGNTPIASSLDRVGAYLEANATAPRHVILVTDGMETCLVPPDKQTATCDYAGGTNYRKCNGCGWQFCLSSGTWSAGCEGNENAFGCTYGQTCQADGQCAGVPGAGSAQHAAQAMLLDGTKTYVIGFGSAVDPVALNSIAAAGGTSSYYPANDLNQLKGVLSQIAGDISCCGNGQLDPGELCDTAIGSGLGACPSTCNDGDPCTLDYKTGAACQQKCEHSPTSCVACGNGVVDAGELCDTAIPAGQAGACPTNCDDGFSCTNDSKVGSGCQQRCEHAAVTQPISGDGCCPPGATDQNDGDCPKTNLCGNGVVDGGEQCDTAIPAGQAGACPTSCDDGNPCTDDSMHGSGCQRVCLNSAVTAARHGDGCCPPGATFQTDNDCPQTSLCGDGKLDPGETCDPKIPPGQPGSCTMTCEDNDPCTRDVVSGEGCSMTCTNVPAPADPATPDGCCPAGKTRTQDADCLPPCTPDRTENCIDPCQAVKCPDGQYCNSGTGQCQPWPNSGMGPTLDEVGGGCDCQLNADHATGWGSLASVLLALLFVARRRRRR